MVKKSEDLLVKILIVLAGLTIGVVVVLTIIAYQIGVDELERPNRIAIISGLLSMFGGIAGAIGAYAIATYQMNRQFKYDKYKEEKQNKERLLHTLKKIELLNKDTIDFVSHFEKEFVNPEKDEIEVKLRIREYDLQYIVNKVDKINDSILLDNHNINFLIFSRELNNMYIDIIGFTHIPEKYKLFSLEDLRISVGNRKEIFDSFDTHVKTQIKKIEKELININVY